MPVATKDEVAAMIEGNDTYPRDPTKTYSYAGQLYGPDYEKDGRGVDKLDEILPSIVKPVEEGDPDPNVKSILPEGLKLEGQQGGGAEAIPAQPSRTGLLGVSGEPPIKQPATEELPE
jgi:hypothetical protein